MQQNLEKDMSDLRHGMRGDRIICSGTNERIALRAAINEFTEEGIRDLIDKAGHTNNIPSDDVYKLPHCCRKYLVEFCDTILYGIFNEAGLLQSKG
jgi:hypothetical protein